MTRSRTGDPEDMPVALSGQRWERQKKVTGPAKSQEDVGGALPRPPRFLTGPVGLGGVEHDRRSRAESPIVLSSIFVHRAKTARVFRQLSTPALEPT